MPDLAQPSPDAGHEGLRIPLVETQSDVGDSLLLNDVALDLVESAMGDISTGNTERGQLQTRVAALEAQVATLISGLAAANVRIDATNISVDTAQDGVDDLQVRVAALEV